MTTRHFRVISILALLILGSQAASSDADSEDGSVRQGLDAEALVRVAEASAGNLTRDVRSAYLAYAAAAVWNELAGAGKQVPDAFVAWVNSEPTVYDAAYGTVYPPDPRILRNIYLLHRDLGTEFCQRYKQLVIAQAVARRMVGVDEGVTNIKEKYFMKGAFKRDLQADNVVWPPEPSPGIRTLRTYGELTMPGVSPTPPGEKPKDVNDAIYDYLHENQTTAAQVYQSAEQTAALKNYAEARGFKDLTRCKNSKQFHGKLKEMMSAKGLRPAQRDPHPSAAEYCLWLAKIHEAEGVSKWPLFSVHDAPWPILLPLGKGHPIREAEHLWDRYIGKIPAHKRLQTYGRYARMVKVRPRQLEPMPWHWNAWPAQLYQGGVCGTMTTIASGTYTSLGVPALKSGQPGHSCIVKYDCREGFFFPVVGQSVSGMFKTTTGWLFADDEGISVNFFEHMALALAVNLGLDEYMDTRIAVNLHKFLASQDRAELGRALLMSAAARNPYNPRTYRILKKAPPGERMAAVDVLQKSVAESMDDFVPWKERNIDVDLGEEDENETTQLALPESWRVGKYRSTMISELTEAVLEVPIPDPATAKQYFPWFDRQVQDNELRFASKRQECLRAIQGPTSFREDCEQAIANHVSQLGKEPLEQDVAVRIASIDQVLRDLRGPETRIAWLTKQEALFAKDKLYFDKQVKYRKKRRHPWKTKLVSTIDPVYDHVVSHIKKQQAAASASAQS